MRWKETNSAGCDIFLIAGASTIVDRNDVVPAGIEAGGESISACRSIRQPVAHRQARRQAGTRPAGLRQVAEIQWLRHGAGTAGGRAAGRRAEIDAHGSRGLLAEIASRPQPRDIPTRRRTAAGTRRSPCWCWQPARSTHGRAEQDASRSRRRTAGRSRRQGGSRFTRPSRSWSCWGTWQMPACVPPLKGQFPGARLRFVVEYRFRQRAQHLSGARRRHSPRSGDRRAVVQTRRHAGRRRTAAAGSPDGGVQPGRGTLDLRADGRQQARQPCCGRADSFRRSPGSPATAAPST